MNNFWTKKNIFTMLMLVACLVVYSFFPTENDILRGIVSGVIFLLVTPLLYVKMILKEPLSEFGFKMGDIRKGWMLFAFGLIASLLISYLLVSYTALATSYYIPGLARDRFDFFMLVFFANAFFLVFYEVIFRSLLMTILKRHLGIWAVVAQAVLFIAFFLIAGNLDWNAVPYVMVALFSGLIFYYSESIVYSISYCLLYFLLFETVIIVLTK